MKNVKNLKSILIIIVFVLSLIFLSLVIIKVRNDRNYLAGQDKLETYAPGAAMAQVYSSASSPSLRNDDKIIGSSKAKIKIFVYEDPSSLYSANLAETLNRIYSENKDEVAIIVRPFVSKGSQISNETALAVECAGEQNKWQEMRSLLFEKAKDESLNLSELETYANQLSLDRTIFSACLTNEEKSAKIERLNSEAINYSVMGAPTIFINDEIVLGARPYDDYLDSNGDNIEGLKTLIGKKLK